MKCQSCSEEVSQKFAHSLATNACPFCGGQIMSEDLQVALSELKDIMQYTDKFKVEIFDWLRTNYSLIDSNSEEYKALEEKAKSTPVKIKVDPKEVKLDAKGNQLTGTPLQDQETTNIFAKRAGISKIVNQIKSKGNSGGGSLLVGGGGDFSDADPEDVAAYQEILNGGVPVVNSAISSNEGFGEDEGEPIPAIVQAFARGKTGQGAADYNPKDVASLENLQQKSRAASRELGQSGGVGLIRRS